MEVALRVTRRLAEVLQMPSVFQNPGCASSAQARRRWPALIRSLTPIGSLSKDLRDDRIGLDRRRDARKALSLPNDEDGAGHHVVNDAFE